MMANLFRGVMGACRLLYLGSSAILTAASLTLVSSLVAPARCPVTHWTTAALEILVLTALVRTFIWSPRRTTDRALVPFEQQNASLSYTQCPSMPDRTLPLLDLSRVASSFDAGFLQGWHLYGHIWSLHWRWRLLGQWMFPARSIATLQLPNDVRREMEGLAAGYNAHHPFFPLSPNTVLRWHLIPDALAVMQQQQQQQHAQDGSSRWKNWRHTWFGTWCSQWTVIRGGTCCSSAAEPVAAETNEGWPLRDCSKQAHRVLRQVLQDDHAWRQRMHFPPQQPPVQPQPQPQHALDDTDDNKVAEGAAAEVGRVVDWPCAGTLASATLIVRRARLRSPGTWDALTVPGLLGAWTAWNSAGLFAATHSCRTADSFESRVSRTQGNRTFRGIPTLFWTQVTMQTCDTVPQGMALLSNTVARHGWQPWSPCHLALADLHHRFQIVHVHQGHPHLWTDARWATNASLQRPAGAPGSRAARRRPQRDQPASAAATGPSGPAGPTVKYAGEVTWMNWMRHQVAQASVRASASALEQDLADSDVNHDETCHCVIVEPARHTTYVAWNNAFAADGPFEAFAWPIESKP